MNNAAANTTQAGVTIFGDVLIRVLDSSRKSIFHFIFNTTFIVDPAQTTGDQPIVFAKTDIDCIAKDKRYISHTHSLMIVLSYLSSITIDI